MQEPKRGGAREIWASLCDVVSSDPAPCRSVPNFALFGSGGQLACVAPTALNAGGVLLWHAQSLFSVGL